MSTILWANVAVCKTTGSRETIIGTEIYMAAGKESTCQCRRRKMRSLGREDLLEKEMATRSRILAWKIPWTEEPGGLQSMGPQRVRHNWATEHTSLMIKGMQSKTTLKYLLKPMKIATVKKTKRNWDLPFGPVVKTPSFYAGGTGLIPDKGTKIPHATQYGQNKAKQQQQQQQQQWECGETN